MDIRCGFIINNLQSNREKAFNARQLTEQVNTKGLPIYYVIKLYYLNSCTVMLRDCREKEQLVELYIKVPIIV